MDGFGRVVGDRLKAVRLSTGLKQKELAARSGINANMINSYEMGKKNHPDIINLMRIADVLNCSLDYLVGRCDFPAMPKPKKQEVTREP